MINKMILNSFGEKSEIKTIKELGFILSQCKPEMTAETIDRALRSRKNFTVFISENEKIVFECD